MEKGVTSKLVYLKTVSTDVWVYTVEYLEQGLAEHQIPSVSHRGGLSLTLFTKALARAGLIRNLWRSSRKIYLVPLMGSAEYRLFPRGYFSEAVVYCFDCWPRYYARWEGMFRRHRIRLAFFSAQQSAAYFAERIPQMRSVWLPEATDPAAYNNRHQLPEREIDVVEVGRRYELWHGQVASGLQERGLVHLYENPRGQLVFPTREQFVQGLGNSRISICFPASLTTPERAGGVETVTHRYFEAMASGCLILGHCPKELSELFGYNPVIEADLEAPLDQLLAVLANIEKYQELVERNYQRLLEVGTWKARVRTMCELWQSS
jgi:hypothetical protein